MGILEQMKLHGSYAELSYGNVRYEFAGPENGEVVVLVHGLMGHMHIWDRQFNYLVSQGFRVLRFDLYGRGFSERVNQTYGSELYISQVVDLVRFVGITDKFHIIGLSMGGAISTLFASHYPDRIKSIFLVDCYGIPTPKDPGIRIVQPKIVGEAVMVAFGGLIVRNGPVKAIFDKKSHRDFNKWFSAPMVIKGSKRALLSTLRHFMLENHAPHYERLNELNVPKLILWGQQDAILSYSYGKKIHALLPTARFETFENCGHVPQYEASEKFNDLTIQFLNKQLCD